MFQATRQNRSRFEAAISMCEVIYVATVQSVRQSHSNALIALLINIMQTMMLVVIFYLMFTLLGRDRVKIQGDFVLYLLSGIFLYMTHIKSVGAVAGSGGPTSSMILHAPMNTFVAIASASLGALYIQFLSVGAVLVVYDLITDNVEFYNMKGAAAMLVMAWFSGICVGMVFLALKPWFPQLSSMARQIYTRANMIASGKMFLANTLPSSMIVMFSWNPLFHIIDQARGYVFVNYNPHYSSTSYPFYLSLVLLVIGLLGEHYSRRHASVSWGARG
ncbi:ABC transporter permease [Aliiroseovarius sp. KMU-50]|uniref:ABC transporter permease n=1 Tax=Aliiroseovarius salicola TaxID=3009082 RepID=A0ABT4VXN2_9RHOB|nr:ABC transporter permease [Aliiroseovarius sp. KMU-50]MDA5093031.1 ABC transporter permease [Aliiroseovarius sp. KMU-50]